MKLFLISFGLLLPISLAFIGQTRNFLSKDFSIRATTTSTTLSNPTNDAVHAPDFYWKYRLERLIKRKENELPYDPTNYEPTDFEGLYRSYALDLLIQNKLEEYDWDTEEEVSDGEWEQILGDYSEWSEEVAKKTVRDPPPEDVLDFVKYLYPNLNTREYDAPFGPDEVSEDIPYRNYRELFKAALEGKLKSYGRLREYKSDSIQSIPKHEEQVFNTVVEEQVHKDHDISTNDGEGEDDDEDGEQLDMLESEELRKEISAILDDKTVPIQYNSEIAIAELNEFKKVAISRIEKVKVELLAMANADFFDEDSRKHYVNMREELAKLPRTSEEWKKRREDVDIRVEELARLAAKPFDEHHHEHHGDGHQEVQSPAQEFESKYGKSLAELEERFTKFNANPTGFLQASIENKFGKEGVNVWNIAQELLEERNKLNDSELKAIEDKYLEFINRA